MLRVYRSPSPSKVISVMTISESLSDSVSRLIYSICIPWRLDSFPFAYSSSKAPLIAGLKTIVFPCDVTFIPVHRHGLASDQLDFDIIYLEIFYIGIDADSHLTIPLQNRACGSSSLRMVFSKDSHFFTGLSQSSASSSSSSSSSCIASSYSSANSFQISYGGS